MSITGTPDGDPVKIGVPICDLVCGLYVALGVLAALRERDRAGERPAPRRLAVRGRRCRSRSGRPASTSPPARSARPLGSAHQSNAPYQAVRTADGWVTVGAVTAQDVGGLLPRARPRGAARRRAVRGRVRRHAHRDDADPRDRGVDHHAHHRRGGRRARRRRRAVRADRRLRAGLHRRPPARARTTSGTPRTRCSGRCASSGRRCGCPGPRPPGQRRAGPRRGHPRRAAGGGYSAPEVDELVAAGVAAAPTGGRRK